MKSLSREEHCIASRLGEDGHNTHPAKVEISRGDWELVLSMEKHSMRRTCGYIAKIGDLKQEGSKDIMYIRDDTAWRLWV